MSLCFSLILCPFLLSIPSYVLLPVPLLLFIPLSCFLSLFFLPPSVLPPITVFPPPFLLWGKVAIPEEKESSIQPAPGEQPLPPRQQDGRASGRPQGAAKKPETSICQQELPRRQRPRDVTHADDRGPCWPGQRQSESCWGCRSGETDLPCLQGGLGVWRAPSPFWVRRCCLSPCLHEGRILWAARGATGQKAKKIAKTQPCLQGQTQTSYALT